MIICETPVFFFQLRIVLLDITSNHDKFRKNRICLLQPWITGSWRCAARDKKPILAPTAEDLVSEDGERLKAGSGLLYRAEIFV